MSSSHTERVTVGSDDRELNHSYAEANEPDPKNLVQWGPIIAGVATTVASMILLTILGLALGASVLEPREAGESVGTFASIWGAVSAIISFFLGGFVAARSTSVIGGNAALLNGFLVGAAVMLLVLYMIGAGIGNIFGTLGSNVGDIVNVAQDQGSTEGVTQQDAEQAVDDVTENVAASADEAFNTAKDAAWGTFAGLLLVHVASTVGGLVGSNSRGDIRRRAPDGTIA